MNDLCGWAAAAAEAAAQAAPAAEAEPAWAPAPTRAPTFPRLPAASRESWPPQTEEALNLLKAAAMEWPSPGPGCLDPWTLALDGRCRELAFWHCQAPSLLRADLTNALLIAVEVLGMIAALQMPGALWGAIWLMFVPVNFQLLFMMSPSQRPAYLAWRVEIATAVRVVRVLCLSIGAATMSELNDSMLHVLGWSKGLAFALHVAMTCLTSVVPFRRQAVLQGTSMLLYTAIIIPGKAVYWASSAARLHGGAEPSLLPRVYGALKAAIQLAPGPLLPFVSGGAVAARCPLVQACTINVFCFLTLGLALPLGLCYWVERRRKRAFLQELWLMAGPSRPSSSEAPLCSVVMPCDVGDSLGAAAAAAAAGMR